MDSVNPNDVNDSIMSAPPVITAKPNKINDLPEDISPTFLPQISTEETEPVKENLSSLNTKALSNIVKTYELERFQKNILIIFNQENFDKYPKRDGGDEDVNRLRNTFEVFGFEIKEHKDLTKDEIINELKTFLSSKNNFTDYGCVAAVILTHGSDKGFIWAKDEDFSETEFKDLFKVTSNQTLVTKPKIVIFQAYQRRNALQAQSKIYRDHDKTVLPVEADILILHSSYGGNPLDWNDNEGSWFIYQLCSKIDSLASSYDLETIMEAVLREVDEESYQVPTVTSSLIRKLYLRKFGDQPTEVDTATDGQSTSFPIENEDMNTPTTSTSLPIPLAECSCRMHYYIYMKNCLEYIANEHPEDKIANAYLGLISDFLDNEDFVNSKIKMGGIIAKHLKENYQSISDSKYLYFQEH